MASVPEIENAIGSVLRGDPEANQWMLKFQETPEAWEVYRTLVKSSQQPEIQYFAANALYSKIRFEFTTLDSSVRDALHQELLTTFSSWQGDRAVASRLALAIAACIVLIPGSIKPLINMLASLNRPDLSQSILEGVAQEYQTNSLSHKQQEALKEELRLALPGVLEILTPLVLDAQPSNQALAFRCLEQWVGFGLGLENVMATPWFEKLLDALENDMLVTEASNAFIALFEVASYPFKDDTMFAIRTIITKLISLRPRFESQANNDDALEWCHAVTKLVSHIGETIVQMVAQAGGQDEAILLGLVEFILEATGHPDTGIAELTIDFWNALQCVPTQERHPQLREPIYINLFQVLLRQCAYPANFTTWEEAEIDETDFFSFRDKAADLFDTACKLLQSHCLSGILSILSNPGSWVELESSVYGLRCISMVYLPILTNTKNSTPQAKQNQENSAALMSQIFLQIWSPQTQQHPAVTATVARATGVYAKFLKMNRDMVLQALGFLLPALGVPYASHDAANAFYSVCAAAAHHLANRETTGELLTSASSAMPCLMPADMVQVADGLARIIAQLPSELQLAHLEKLVGPVISQLEPLANTHQPSSADYGTVTEMVVTELKIIAVGLRYLERSTAEVNPVMSVMERALPILNAISLNWSSNPPVIEALCEVYKMAILSAKTKLLPLLPSIVTALTQCYDSTMHPPCLAAVATAVEMYGGYPDLRSSFVDLLVHIAEVTSPVVRRDVTEYPDVIRAFFEMLKGYMIFCAGAVLKSPSLPVVIELGICCLNIQQRESARAALMFLSQLLTHRVEQDQNDILEVLVKYGETMTLGVVVAIANTMPLGLMPHLATILYSIAQRVPDAMRQWMVRALSSQDLNVKPEVLTDEDKHRVLHLVMALNDQRRFKAMVTDFAKLCRSQGSSDALLAYEM